MVAVRLAKGSKTLRRIAIFGQAFSGLWIFRFGRSEMLIPVEAVQKPTKISEVTKDESRLSER